MKEVEIFTDGACRGNPGPGGWGALLRYGDNEKKIYGGDRLTTNNRMELMAVICSLEALTEPCSVSKYVIQGINDWIEGWKAKGWKTANKKPVKNVDLWQRLEKEASSHEVEWMWVKGHSGHRENEMADQLANQGIDELSS